jgi:hypothetical protein
MNAISTRLLEGEIPDPDAPVVSGGSGGPGTFVSIQELFELIDPGMGGDLKAKMHNAMYNLGHKLDGAQTMADIRWIVEEQPRTGVWCGYGTAYLFRESLNRLIPLIRSYLAT